MKFILARKLEMTQIFDKETGKVIPVTLVEAGPCKVVQVKTKEKDGYFGVQVGFLEKKTKNISKALLKHFKNLGVFRYLREFRVDENEIQMVDGGLKMKIDDKEIELKPGANIDVSIFKEGDKIKVSGLSKGKGFQGVVKRYGFKGGPKTHGQKDRERAPGSIGATTPQRVIKGKKMPGRCGQEKVTIKNLEIVRIDTKANILAIKGAVPGARNSLLMIYG